MRKEKRRIDCSQSCVPYPFETLRRCYVTLFGGVSPDLLENQVGINHEALKGNTELDVFDRVAVGVLGEGRTRPFFMERLYNVTALDDTKPDAVAKSEFGEAVFSVGIDRTRKPFDTLKEGRLIVLSAVLADPDARDRGWRLDLLAKALRELRILEP